MVSTLLFSQIIINTILETYSFTHKYEKQQDGKEINLHFEQELAEVFAPYLFFDPESNQFPMNAEIFYSHVIMRDYAQKMNNRILDIITNPTYFHVIYCSDNALRIEYVWFYGYQGECNTITPSFILERYPKLSSVHNGDWEHIIVDINITKNEYNMNKILYTAHGDHFTKRGNEFKLNNKTHPSVHVGLIQHGSYHNSHETLLFPCLFWDDQRRNGGKILKTEKNLINIKSCNDGWCQFFKHDQTPNFDWGPNGKNGIGNFIFGGIDKCNIDECEKQSCPDSFCSLINYYGNRVKIVSATIVSWFININNKPLDQCHNIKHEDHVYSTILLWITFLIVLVTSIVIAKSNKNPYRYRKSKKKN